MCSKYSFLTFENIYKYKIGTIMYKFRNALLPRCFDHMFKVNKSINIHIQDNPHIIMSPLVETTLYTPP